MNDDTGSYSDNFGSVAPTPTPIPNGSFGQGVSSTGSSQAQFTFQPSGWTAGYVILLDHTVAGGGQQNLNMTYNGGASRWEYTAGGISSGYASYSFTYQKGGLHMILDGNHGPIRRPPHPWARSVL